MAKVVSLIEVKTAHCGLTSARVVEDTASSTMANHYLLLIHPSFRPGRRRNEAINIRSPAAGSPAEAVSMSGQRVA
jgi:hypothetical protein